MIRQTVLAGILLTGILAATPLASSTTHAATFELPLGAQTLNGAPSSGFHALGFAADAASPAPPSPPIVTLSNTTLPTSVDLSGSAPPVGDQGQVNSCTAWATGY
jgi:hypothetical protein